MVKEFQVEVEGKFHQIVVSDEQGVLLAAKAAGRAVLGIYDRGNPGQMPFGVPYLIERGTPVSGSFLERVIRRHMGLPWNIAETKRLLIREFAPNDWEYLEEPEKEIYGQPAGFLEYIRNQYPFYEYGMWAVVEKSGQAVIGTAGVKNLEVWGEELKAVQGEELRAVQGGELGIVQRDASEEMQEALEIGYQIHLPFRRRGYGQEAVKAVVNYAEENLPYPLYARIQEENVPSRILAERAGFIPVASIYASAPQSLSPAAPPEESGTKIRLYRYARNQ